jgi:hypothetical protein
MSAMPAPPGRGGTPISKWSGICVNGTSVVHVQSKDHRPAERIQRDYLHLGEIKILNPSMPVAKQ